MFQAYHTTLSSLTDYHFFPIPTTIFLLNLIYHLKVSNGQSIINYRKVSNGQEDSASSMRIN